MAKYSIQYKLTAQSDVTLSILQVIAQTVILLPDWALHSEQHHHLLCSNNAVHCIVKVCNKNSLCVGTVMKTYIQYNILTLAAASGG